MSHRHLLLAALLCLAALAYSGAEGVARSFRVWAAGDSHVTADIKVGRESLAKPIRQSEGREEGAPAFEWDIMVDVGDLSASQYPPTDDDGRELVRQYRALAKHYREDVYNVPGNHDAPYYDHGPGAWSRKWADPLGENTVHSDVDSSRRRFAVEGTWERYGFVAGNVLFLMLSDRNDCPTPVGRGHSRGRGKGGFPAGAVTRETFEWWKRQVLESQDKLIVSAHHHMLRDTTMRSGYGEGEGFHGRSGGVEGSSYLYFIIENEDPADFRYTADAHVFEDFLENFQAEHGRPVIDLWIGGHSHVMHPTQVNGGKGITEQKWGVTFVNASALTVRHSGGVPMSRLLTFTDGSDRLTVDLYLHERSKRGDPVGWFAPAFREVTLRRPFMAPPPDARPPPPAPLPQPPGPRIEPDGPATPQSVPEAGELVVSDTPEWRARAPDGPLRIERPSQRVNLGAIPMEDWTDLTVSARVRTTAENRSMRVVSKDRIGQKGNFMLWFRQNGEWAFQAYDKHAGKWQTAAWRSTAVNDGGWHHLTGVVDPGATEVRLYVDGVLRGTSKWTAASLDDSDATDLVVGTESSSRREHVLRGEIDDVRLYRRALAEAEITALAEHAR